MSANNPSHWTHAVCVLLTVMLAAYIGMYCTSLGHGPSALIVPPPEQVAWEKSFFAPIHWLDKKIRPHVWKR